MKCHLMQKPKHRLSTKAKKKVRVKKMPDKNLTDNEVVRILEETIEYNNRIGRPTAIMDIYSLELFLELIKRQNEQLQANSDSRQTNEFKNIDVARFEAEINRLQVENDELKSDIAILKDSNINLQELYQTEREKVTKARFCPECKKLKKAEDNRKRNEEVRSVKIKPRAENKYERETDALFAFVRNVDRHNKENGTRYSYGQFEDAIHNRKIKIVGCI